jgi:hypothetical protein
VRTFAIFCASHPKTQKELPVNLEEIKNNDYHWLATGDDETVEFAMNNTIPPGTFVRTCGLTGEPHGGKLTHSFFDLEIMSHRETLIAEMIDHLFQIYTLRCQQLGVEPRQSYGLETVILLPVSELPAEERPHSDMNEYEPIQDHIVLLNFWT